jgi:large conductance mechanosensitive channel
MHKTNKQPSFAASFTAVANSLVTDILLPLFSCLPGLSHNLDEAFLVLQNSKTSKIKPTPPRKTPYYNTVQQALDDGAIVWAYGNFIDKLLRFILIALALFTVARIYGWLSSDNIVKRQIKCKYCRKYISDKAKRCVNCTSWLDGREDASRSTENSTAQT